MELLISMAISLIIIGTLISILGGGIDIFNRSISMEKNIYEGRYALDYISREIRRSKEIYPIEDVNFNINSDNLGFILKMKPYKTSKYDWQYIYYEFSGEKLIRKTKKSDKDNLKDLNNFINSGQNNICENVKSIDGSFYDRERDIINISIKIGNSIEKEFSTSVYTGLKKKDD